MVGSSRIGGFLASVHPLLERGEHAALLSVLSENWPPPTLRALLSAGAPPIRRAAAQCLGLSGAADDAQALASLLGAADAALVRVAEDALWGIWMRSGSPDGNEELARAGAYLRDDEFGAAISALRELTRREPEFAEAHHQLALALHSNGQADEAAQEYRRTVALNPQHYAAWCGLGHLCSEGRDLRGALENYRAALHIHPRLAEIREIVPRIEAALQPRSVA